MDTNSLVGRFGRWVRDDLALLMRVVTIGGLTLGSRTTQADPPPGYEMVWHDEFDTSELDAGKWKNWQIGPRRDAINTPEAVTIEDGLLTITTYSVEDKHFTGMVSTEGLFESCYGYWEASISFQDAPGTWSVFWSHSPTIGYPVNDIAKAGMEIDIVEHRELDHEGKNIAGIAAQNLHWGGYGEFHNGTGQATPDLQLGSGFHVYGFEWTETGYRFYIDGKLTWTTQHPISRRKQFMVLSTEVESELWSGAIPLGGYGDRATSTTKMSVDYVRYYVRRP